MEQVTLERARDGDEQAFGELTGPYRHELQVHCYRMLGFSTGEAASLLNTSQTTIKGLLQRARVSLGRHRGSADRARPGSAQERDLAGRFARAFVAGDVDGVVALLADDAWLSMPPAPHEYHGIDAIGAFLRASFGWRGQRRVLLVPAHANSQPAFGSYVSHHTKPIAIPAGLIVLTAGGDRIQAITRFHVDTLYPRFGLPLSLTKPEEPPRP